MAAARRAGVQEHCEIGTRMTAKDNYWLFWFCVKTTITFAPMVYGVRRIRVQELLELELMYGKSRSSAYPRFVVPATTGRGCGARRHSMD
jgi:hypothetical protein